MHSTRDGLCNFRCHSKLSSRAALMPDTETDVKYQSWNMVQRHLRCHVSLGEMNGVVQEPFINTPTIPFVARHRLQFALGPMPPTICSISNGNGSKNDVGSNCHCEHNCLVQWEGEVRIIGLLFARRHEILSLSMSLPVPCRLASVR